MNARFGDGESYASLYRKAVHEATRVELSRAINEIRAATHAVIARHGRPVVYWYGSLAVCEDVERGIERDVKVVPFTVEMKLDQETHKVRVYR